MKPKSEIKISGRVVRGMGYGRRLGFPTANLDRHQYSRQRLKIKLGIWAGRAEIPSRNVKSKIQISSFKSYPAAIVIGPLDRRGLPKIEAHILDFRGNLYDKHLSLYLNTYLRPFKKFSGEAGLKVQIRRDVAIARRLSKKFIVNKNS